MKHFVEPIQQFYFDPRMINCPTLLLDGETENKYSKGVGILQEVALEAINHTQKKRIIGLKNLGADGRCLVANTSYLAGVTFDWLDEVFNFGTQ